jgi:putative transposase
MRYPTMFALLLNLLATLRPAFRTRAELALENLALQQQLATLSRSAPRPGLRRLDHAFWIALSQIWHRWADALVLVKPDTVVRWHRAGFRLFWRWKSRSRTPAKDDVPAEVKQLIRRMAEANVTGGAPRIHGELLKLGIEISERSVSRFMPKRERKPPSQTWRTFLDNHLGWLASIDFFAVPTATFRVLLVFLV